MLNLVYYWLTHDGTGVPHPEQRQAELDAILNDPPDGEGLPDQDAGPWSADEEMAAFHQAQSSTAAV